MKSRKSIFTRNYVTNFWHGKTSQSGSGSGLDQTETLRIKLPQLLKKLKVKTLIDAPCGDCNWIERIALININYIGIDIVLEVIEKNKKKDMLFSNTSFQCQDLVEDFPQEGDLLLCRDLLGHLSFKSAKRVIENFISSNITYLLITTFNRKENKDFKDGESWYAIDLTKKPFNFPNPLLLLNENCTENKGKYKDKSLGLWRREDLVNWYAKK